MFFLRETKMLQENVESSEIHLRAEPAYRSPFMRSNRCCICLFWMCEGQQVIPTGMTRCIPWDSALYMRDLVHGFQGSSYAFMEYNRHSDAVSSHPEIGVTQDFPTLPLVTLTICAPGQTHKAWSLR